MVFKQQSLDYCQFERVLSGKTDFRQFSFWEKCGGLERLILDNLLPWLGMKALKRLALDYFNFGRMLTPVTTLCV